MCSLCIMNILEDEYHFVLVCPFYSTIKDKYIKPYYYNTPSTFKLTTNFIDNLNYNIVGRENQYHCDKGTTYIHAKRNGIYTCLSFN